jgi:hypothetical protein
MPVIFNNYSIRKMLLIKKCYTNGGGKWSKVGDGALLCRGFVMPNPKPLIPNHVSPIWGVLYT